jgi:hypothetical protein
MKPVQKRGLAAVFVVFLIGGCADQEHADPSGPVSDSGDDDARDARDKSTDTGSAVTDATATDSQINDVDGGDVTDDTSLETFDSTVADMGVDSAVADTGVDSAVAETGVDTAVADTGFKSVDHVHIYIDNFCRVSTSPTVFRVPSGETLKLSYHNHSVDYEADVWMMYNGGYLELARGGTWNETYVHCSGPNASTGWADISIAGGGGSACPKVRLYIYCL